MLVTATDVTIVRRLLDGPADSADELARRIVYALYENDDPKSIAARRGAVLLAVPGRVLYGIGPYPTVNGATKATEDGSVPALGIERLVPIPLIHPLKWKGK